MSYEIQISEESHKFLKSLDEKSLRICKNNLSKLENNPYPGYGKGDKEKIVVQGEEIYRIHIGRTFTAFYVVLKDRKLVRIIEILPIDEAHKKYGY